MLLGLISHYFFGLTIFITSLFLVLLVLVQRGRGGGIAGALGGAGGQSAFGTKAGDLFTRITVGVASVWILLCCLAIYFLKTPEFSTGIKEKSSVSATGKGDTAGATGGGLGGSGTTSDLSGSGLNLTPPTSIPGTPTGSAVPEVTTFPGASTEAPNVPASENPPAATPPAENSSSESTPGSAGETKPDPVQEPGKESAPGDASAGTPSAGETPTPANSNNG